MQISSEQRREGYTLRGQQTAGKQLFRQLQVTHGTRIAALCLPSDMHESCAKSVALKEVEHRLTTQGFRVQEPTIHSFARSGKCGEKESNREERRLQSAEFQSATVRQP